MSSAAAAGDYGVAATQQAQVRLLSEAQRIAENAAVADAIAAVEDAVAAVAVEDAPPPFAVVSHNASALVIDWQGHRFEITAAGFTRATFPIPPEELVVSAGGGEEKVGGVLEPLTRDEEIEAWRDCLPTCPICLEGIGRDDVKVMSCCAQPFHQSCIAQQREYSLVSQYSTKCPVCRGEPSDRGDSANTNYTDDGEE